MTFVVAIGASQLVPPQFEQREDAPGSPGRWESYDTRGVGPIERYERMAAGNVWHLRDLFAFIGNADLRRGSRLHTLVPACLSRSVSCHMSRVLHILVG